MIHFLFGVPGSGKGVIAADRIENELARGSRVILTDMALRLDPWVRNISSSSSWGIRRNSKKYQSELGLLAYLDEKYGDTFGAADRIYLFGESEAKEFYLRRYDVKEKKWVVLDADRDEKGRIQRFETLRATHGCLMITDEFWAAAGSRDWQNTAQGLTFYAAQHRKFGDEWFIVCQHPKQIETQLRMLAHDCWECRNLSKIPLGPFRRGDKFAVAIYDKIPSGPSSKPLRKYTLELDKRGLGGCFDTAAGSGVSGGGSADINEKKRGLPFWALVVCILVGIALISQTPKLFSWVAAKLIPSRPSGSPWRTWHTNSSAAGAVAVSPGLLESVSSLFKAGDRTALNSNLPPPVLFCGYFRESDRVRYFLSDGSIREMREHYYKLPDGTVQVDGKVYGLKTPQAGEQPTIFPDVRDLSFRPAPAPGSEPPEVSVTVIGQRHENSKTPHPTFNPLR